MNGYIVSLPTRALQGIIQRPVTRRMPACLPACILGPSLVKNGGLIEYEYRSDCSTIVLMHGPILCPYPQEKSHKPRTRLTDFVYHTRVILWDRSSI